LISNKTKVVDFFKKGGEGLGIFFFRRSPTIIIIDNYFGIDNKIVINFQMSAFRKLVEFGETQQDVTFSVGPEGEEEEVKSSVFILSALSPVFRSMFGKIWKGQEKVIPLPDIQPKVFRAFLEVLCL